MPFLLLIIAGAALGPPLGNDPAARPCVPLNCFACGEMTAILLSLIPAQAERQPKRQSINLNPAVAFALGAVTTARVLTAHPQGEGRHSRECAYAPT
jgi:hypothetical protein